MDKVFLSLPTHDGRRTEASAMGAYCFPTKAKYHIVPAPGMDSLLAHGFNNSWCTALNLRKEHKFKYFAMLHNDVGPSRFWIDVMADEMRRTGADVISAVIPIKNEMGLTSTGMDYRPNEETRMLRRLTMTEVMEMPETFGAEDTLMPDAPLLINTGCWLCDFTKPWVEKVRFTINDMIGKNPETGEFVAISDPEDWDFSRQLHRLGLKVMATRKVRIEHQGNFKFTNDQAWGTWKQDEQFMEAQGHREKCKLEERVYDRVAG